MCPQCFETGGQHDQIYPPDKKALEKLFMIYKSDGKNLAKNRREEENTKKVDNKHRKQKGKIFGWS